MGILKSGAAIFEILIFWPVSANFIAKKCISLKKITIFCAGMTRNVPKNQNLKNRRTTFQNTHKISTSVDFYGLGAPSSPTYVILAKN